MGDKHCLKPIEKTSEQPPLDLDSRNAGCFGIVELGFSILATNSRSIQAVQDVKAVEPINVLTFANEILKRQRSHRQLVEPLLCLLPARSLC